MWGYPYQGHLMEEKKKLCEHREHNFSWLQEAADQEKVALKLKLLVSDSRWAANHVTKHHHTACLMWQTASQTGIKPANLLAKQKC